MKYSIYSLESADNPIVLFRGIVGSRAYGTQNANSDRNVRGIFVVPSTEYARLLQPPTPFADVLAERPQLEQPRNGREARLLRLSPRGGRRGSPRPGHAVEVLIDRDIPIFTSPDSAEWWSRFLRSV